MNTRRAALTVAACAAVLSGVVGCSSGSGGLLQPPATPVPADQVISVTGDAAQKASAVHVKGTITSSGSKIGLDIQLNKSSAAGTMTLGGAGAQLINANGASYIQLSQALMQQGGIPPAAQPVLLNKWINVDSPVFGGQMSDVKSFLDYSTFIKGIFNNATAGKLSSAGTSTVNGTAAFVYKDTDGSTAYVAQPQPHYLLRMVGPSSDPGTVDFTNWNQPVPVSPPPASEIYSGS
ncbi:MAG TPA: hypothetical protein VG317_03120 [Pseudonocardiaceae bacterium]|jgi:hypothetical protein|nr:hypothetical protein [Pseudonocardiaceae bacterium]